MATPTNTEILQTIYSTASAEYQSVVTKSTTASGIEVLESLAEYPTAKNEFINTLVNKIAVQKVYSNPWENPLKRFYKGKLLNGQTIEMTFIANAKRKAYGEHFDGSTTDEGDIFGKVLPEITTKYTSINFMNKYKATINESMLRAAFQSEYGLSDLINAIVNSLNDGAEMDSYTLSKHCLYTMVGSAATENNTKMFINLGAEVSDTNAKSLLEKIRATGGRLKFKAKDYNIAKVLTASKQNKLVVLVTPETKAVIDVGALAAAFNIPQAEIQYSVVEVDELPSWYDTYSPPAANELIDPSTGLYKDIVSYDICTELQNAQIDAIVCDEDAFEMWDTLNTSRTIENPNTLDMNIFLHRQGIAGSNPFANFVCFYHKIDALDTTAPVGTILTPAVGATGVAVEDTVFTASWNENISFGDGNITLHLYSDDSLVDTIPATDLTFDNITNVSTYVSDVTLTAATKYYLLFEANCFVNGAGLGNLAVTDKDFYSFTTA